MNKLCLIGIAVLLTACGGGGDGPRVDTTPPPVVAPPMSTIDAFFTRVMGFVAGQSETEEPGDISLIVMTAPEDTEPVPLS